MPRKGKVAAPIDWSTAMEQPSARPRLWAVGAVLVGLGPLLFLLSLALAFTIYGEISAAVGLACLVAGIVVLGRPPPSS